MRRLLLVAAICVFALTVVGAASGAKSGSALASFTRSGTYSWVVPHGIKAITIDLRGASGGAAYPSADGTPGLGGETSGTFSVQPGEVLELVVGGQGLPGSSSAGGQGGFNGGGSGGYFVGYNLATGQNVYEGGGGGGGATDVRSGSCAASLSCDLQARVLAASGGGGAGAIAPVGSNANGGFGGGYFGGSGGYQAGGATQTAGGSAATGCAGAADGSFGQGGDGSCGGGGGGAGWFGGGGGTFEGGGGGSGYILPAIFGAFQTGVQNGDGNIVIRKAS